MIDDAMIDAAWERHKAAAPRLISERTLRTVLADHWLTAVVCDHEAKTDRPVCSCSEWRCDPQPSVGAAINTWIEHVVDKAVQDSR